jgi:S1-C subfamily serine protease
MDPTQTMPANGGEQSGSGRRTRRPRRSLLAGGVLLAAVIAAAVAILVQTGGGAAHVGRLAAPFRITQASALAAPASTSAIKSRVDPGLVNITVSNPSLGFHGQATGMVLTPSGVVLTNNHVVQGATTVKATDVGNGRTYTGSVVGYDRSGDIAVIQLRGAGGLKTVPLGTSTSVVLGGRVTALGNAGGGGGTPRAATGSVVGLGKSIIAADLGGANAERLSGLIEVNAAVLPGDSGGPLVNDAGQVVGMDAAASSANGQYTAQQVSSRAFAIPIDTALAVVQGIETGQATPGVHIGPTAFLGVAVVPSSPFAPGGSMGGKPGGVVVGQALPGYPAARVGLTQGDLITSVNGRPVTTAQGLTDALTAYHPGDTVRIAWTSPTGQTHSVPVKLASGPPA